MKFRKRRTKVYNGRNLERERERENRKGRGRFWNKRGFLRCGGEVAMKKRSDQSNFCSSLTTKACPNPSTSPSLCHSFFFSSIGRSNNFCVSIFIFSINVSLTPWFTNCITAELNFRNRDRFSNPYN